VLTVLTIGAQGRRCLPWAASASDRHRGEPQERRGPAPRAARAGREHLATGDFVARRQAKPGGEVLCARPGGEVVAALGNQLERNVWGKTVDLR